MGSMHPIHQQVSRRRFQLRSEELITSREAAPHKKLKTEVAAARRERRE
jgi:hypothetical protein